MVEKQPVQPPANREKTPLQGVTPGESVHEHGIPHEGGEGAEPKGTPNSDRHETETAPKRT